MKQLRESGAVKALMGSYIVNGTVVVQLKCVKDGMDMSIVENFSFSRFAKNGDVFPV